MSRGNPERGRDALMGEVAEAIRRYGSANDAVDAAAAERLGVNRTDMRVMDILDQAGGGASAGELAEASGLSTGAITSVVDRLERQRYVRRRRDPDDRRRVLVELTDKARKATREIYGPLAEEGYRNLRRYSNEQLHLIRELIVGATEVLASHTDRIRRRRG